MTRMLVVASPTLDPLCTDGPIPTDGQPEWVMCRVEGCGRWPAESAHGWNPDPDELDGPYPFTVAVWQEVATCGACDSTFPWPPRDLPPVCDLHASGRCDPWEDPVGAVVATVEVTGKGHHADECAKPAWAAVAGIYVDARCDPDIPDGWHTPTGEVSRLDVPVPMERPMVRLDGAEVFIAEHGLSWWWAELDLEVTA